jgi:hypothetical protein
MQRQDEKSKITSEFAPALPAEPVFERPEAGRWDYAEKIAFTPEMGTPTGAWADARSSFGLETRGGFGFVDPGSFALASHSSPMMLASSIGAGALRSASSDLGSAADFGGDDDGNNGKRAGGLFGGGGFD